MLIVKNGPQEEPLINIGKDFKLEQSTDGTFTVSSSFFPTINNPGYTLLKSETIVTVDENDFRVKQYSHTQFSKTITAISTFYDNTTKRQHAVFSGSHTLQNHANFALHGTGWTCTVDNTIANIINYIDKFGNDNVVSLIAKICKYHKCEYVILPNKKIHFSKQIGGDYDYQYRYKHNLSDVVLKEDTTNLYTFIRGFGADGLEVSYTSPNHTIFGIKEAEPIYDDRFTDAQALINYIASQLQDVPELAIESSIPELTAREIGETVWLIYDPLGIEMQTRILKQTKVLKDGQLITSSVVFGNTLVKLSTDLLVEQQVKLNETNEFIEETKEELEENIDEAKQEYRSKFDQTDSRITLEVEQLETSIAAIDIKADNISLSVNNRITNEMASINIRADQIQSTVSSQNISISNLDNRMGSAESSITQQSWQISQKVSTTDYNGNTIASLINQTSTTIDIQASKINLVGAVTVLSDLSGNLGTITSGNINIKEDIYMGRRLYFSDMTSVGGSDGTIRLNAWNDIEYSGIRHYFNGTVDFSRANVTGFGGNYAMGHTSGIGIAYSASTKRLYVRINGSDVGYVTLT